MATASAKWKACGSPRVRTEEVTSPRPETSWEQQASRRKSAHPYAVFKPFQKVEFLGQGQTACLRLRGCGHPRACPAALTEAARGCASCLGCAGTGGPGVHCATPIRKRALAVSALYYLRTIFKYFTRIQHICQVSADFVRTGFLPASPPALWEHNWIVRRRKWPKPWRRQYATEGFLPLAWQVRGRRPSGDEGRARLPVAGRAGGFSPVLRVTARPLVK